jgi:disulfide bond formation protein DsbB
MIALTQAHRVPLALFAASVGALGIAYVAELGFGLAPCVLCLYQRVPYAAVAALAWGALLKPGWRRPALALSGVALVVGAGIAAYHVGVEQHWWEGTAACGGALTSAQTVEELMKQLQAKPAPRCDTPAWTLFGISMAGYNMLFSAILAILAFGATRRP